jgi:hypothetical protein
VTLLKSPAKVLRDCVFPLKNRAHISSTLYFVKEPKKLPTPFQNYPIKDLQI